MTVRRITSIERFVGLSGDSKPTGVPVGSTFLESDTNFKYTSYDGTNWIAESLDAAIITTATTIDLNQAAGDYDLYTATGGTVYIDAFTITLPNVDCSDDLTITSISVQTDMATVTVLLSAVAGAVANLTALASFTYSGSPFVLTVGKKIQLTIAGGAADAPTVCTVSAQHQAITPAAYLA